jgi:hypothetical protein
MMNRVLGVDCSSLTRPMLIDPTHDSFLDLRAKRKLIGLQDTVWYVYGPNFSGTTSITFQFDFRTLLLLS